jgi:hypothetical protein
MIKEKILIIHKGQFDNFPPLMSVKNGLNNIGYSVDVLTCNLITNKLFNTTENVIVVRNLKKYSILSNLVWYFNFLSKLFSLLRNSTYKYIWIEGGDTLALFGWIIKSKPNRIFQLSELYDKVPIYKYLIGKYIARFPKVVVPEINRAYIIKTRYNLNELPFVLPNKPNYNIEKDFQIIDSNTNNVISNILSFANDRKIILYQGLISNDRKFDGIIDFVIENRQNYCLVLLGKDTGYLSSIDVDKRAVYYAGFLLPPNHLHITKIAWTCIMAYDTTSLNKVYCAPNKIWEYTKHKKPILSQDLPGIKMLLSEYRIGVCCDVMNKNDVKRSINEIENNYSEMSKNTEKFYDSIDVNSIIESILRA